MLRVFRCEEEDVSLSEQALNILKKMAGDTTLRYVLNLISCAQMLARKRRSESISEVDIRRAYTYFFDEKRSVQWIKEQENELVSEEGVDFAAGGRPFEKLRPKPAGEEVMDES